jgi:cell division protein FtsB
MKIKKIILIFLFVTAVTIGLAITIFGQRGFIHMVMLEKELEEFRNQNSQLQKENDAIKQEIELLKNNFKHMEELARKELGLVKKDELVYHLK